MAKKKKEDTVQTTDLGDVSNDAAQAILCSAPYTARVTLRGVDKGMLFHRYSPDAVAAKATAKKGSEEKKTDNLESYVWRDEENRLCLPGHYVVASMTNQKTGAAKYRQDPRSPRASALHLFRACVLAVTDLAPLVYQSKHLTTWCSVDRRGVPVGSGGGRITRHRPHIYGGWEATVDLLVMQPEYINQQLLLDVLTDAGRFAGVGDFRPTFGRFQVVNFNVLKDAPSEPAPLPLPHDEMDFGDRAAAGELGDLD